MQIEMQVAQGLAFNEDGARPEVFGAMNLVITTHLERLQLEELLSMEMLEMAKERALKRMQDENIPLKSDEDEVCSANNAHISNQIKNITQCVQLVMACDVQPVIDLRKIEAHKSEEERRQHFERLREKHGIPQLNNKKAVAAAALAGLLKGILEKSLGMPGITVIPMNKDDDNPKDPNKMN